MTPEARREAIIESRREAGGCSLSFFEQSFLEECEQFCHEHDLDIRREVKSFRVKQGKYFKDGHNMNENFRRWLQQAVKFNGSKQPNFTHSPESQNKDAHEAWNHVLSEIRGGTYKYRDDALRALQRLEGGSMSIRMASPAALNMIKSQFIALYGESQCHNSTVQPVSKKSMVNGSAHAAGDLAATLINRFNYQ